MIQIYVNPPRQQGFGWTVDCSEACDIAYDRMLSEYGAEASAKTHKAEHAVEIIKTRETAWL